MKTMRMRRLSVGFSLVELLVVIGIIALLATMLFPVLSQAQEKAKRAHCLNNLSQFGKAMAMYAMDHEEFYPSNLVELAAEGYADDAELFKCRSDRWRTAARNAGEINAGTADTHCSYNLVTQDTDGGPAGSSSPSKMMVACDKDGPNGSVTTENFGGNHGGDGGHLLYGDGSVRWRAETKWNTNVWGMADIATVVGY